MLKRIVFAIAIVVMAFPELNAQYSKDEDYKKYFAGSTFFLLGNLSSTNKPDFVQVNFGYRLSHRDAISLELKTWKYAWSLGIPYGDSFEDPAEKFPGYIREYGFALAYQRFWWKGLYTGVHVMSAWQSFFDESNNRVDKGFQFFNTYRIGYHFKLFDDQFFIEPSIAITHRPYHTEMPAGFKEKDDQWPKHFIGEPGLHFGFNF
ncbi:hypothetical protein [Roseivirga sp.]|uniref:hypothetical protein n=1 Tax=Roseivirga sp. TaxID=1964215 RepID=UPI003B524F31